MIILYSRVLTKTLLEYIGLIKTNKILILFEFRENTTETAVDH